MLGVVLFYSVSFRIVLEIIVFDKKKFYTPLKMLTS